MQSESGVTLSIIDELHSWDIKGVKSEGEIVVTQSIIDELHSADLVKWKIKMALLEV